MTFKDEIINSYEARSSNANLNETEKAQLLFDIMLQWIIKNKWTYFPEGKEYTADFILNCNDFESLQVNCFELSDTFVALCKELGIPDADIWVYEFKPSSKIGQQIVEAHEQSQYIYQCFDKQFECTDNQVCFDNHCVAKVNGRFYDLVFSCSYQHIDAPYDVGPFAQLISFLYAGNETEALRVLQTFHEIDIGQTFMGESLLHIAARLNFVPVASFLLAKGIDANKLSKLDPPQVALEYVTEVNSPLFLLLSQYTDPVMVSTIKQEYANQYFMDAVQIILNKDENVEAFARAIQDIDINFKGNKGWTFLHYVTCTNNLAVAEFLLEKGAQANIKDDEDWPPLYYAVDSELFTLLSKYTDPVMVKQLKQDKARQHFIAAVEIIRNRGTIEEFSKAIQDIDINFKGDAGLTLLHWAANTNNLAVAEFLLRKGALVTIKDDESMTAAYYVAENDTSMSLLLGLKIENFAYDSAKVTTNVALLPHPSKKAAETNFSPLKDSNISVPMSISMQILGGFIAVVGCAAIAAVLILLQVTPVVAVGLGIASVVIGFGLFSRNTVSKADSWSPCNEQKNILLKL